MADPTDTPTNPVEQVTVQKPKAVKMKTWDEMTDEEKAAEIERRKEAMAVADKPDPAFERSVEKTIGSMRRLFAGQRRYNIMLFQITPAMKAEGMKELPSRECGINGYNFVVPRGVPVPLPEGLIHVLYQAGEINPANMLQLGLLTPEQVAQDQRLSQEEAKKIASLGGVLPN